MNAILLLGMLACADWFVWDSAVIKPGTEGGGEGGDDSGTSSTSTHPGGFCKEELPDDPPGGPDCVSERIGCGDTIEGTTSGGSSVLNESLYDPWFCGYPFPASYEGPERVYLLDVEGSNSIDVTLDSACSEVDLFAIHFNDDRCPYKGVSISECENSWDDGDDFLNLYTDQSYRYFLVVESRSGKATNFRLTVNCTPL